MPKVVPSQIVQYIDKTFADNERRGLTPILLGPSTSGALNALLRLAEQVPNALLPSDPAVYAGMIRSLEEIRFFMKRAESHNYNQLGPPSLRGATNEQPGAVAVIRAAFAQCPDEISPFESRELAFISDADIRSGLLQDLATTRSALLHEEWKAATVIAGSLVEALLLWAIQPRSTVEIQNAASAAVANRCLDKLPPVNPLDWSLGQYIEIAAQLGLIDKDTRDQARLAKNFRNLIHPGRSLKKQQDCDRGTALAANAAVNFVARDLEQHFLPAQ